MCWVFVPIYRPSDGWDSGVMPNAQAMTGMGAGAEPALAEAIERVFVALGVGTQTRDEIEQRVATLVEELDRG